MHGDAYVTFGSASGSGAGAGATADLARAEELLDAGRLAEAESLCAQLLAGAPNQLEALHLRGVCERQRGDLGRSAQTLQEVTRRDPNNALAQLDFGRTLLRLGRAPDALAAFERATQLDESLATAQHNLGVALEYMGRYAEAIARYERSFALSHSLASLAGCANCLVPLGRRQQAVDTYRRVLEIELFHADACANLAALLMERGEVFEPVVLLERALTEVPQHAAANRNHATLLEALVPRLDALLNAAHDPASTLPDLDTQLACARALTLLDRTDEALKCLDALVARQPEAHALRVARVEAMLRGGCTDRADEVLNEIARLRADAPDDARLACWCGLLHINRGENEAARRVFASALGTAQDRFARLHLGLLDLREGHLPQGWAGFELRGEDDALGLRCRYFSQSRWHGEENISEQTLLVHSETGLGDSILFSRYLPLVRARVRRLVFEVPGNLHSLMWRSLGQEVITITRGAPLPKFDRHCPLLSLPLVCGTRADTIPGAVPRLNSDPARVELWRDRLGPVRGTRIGVAWSGDPRHPQDWQRRVPLKAFLAAIDSAAVAVGTLVEPIVLQDACRVHDRGALAAAKNVRYFGKALGDFDDTAALIELCELFIGIDVPAAHLAGAMGKRAWVMVPVAGDWRWFTGRDDTPWYPQTRLLRQRVPGDWSEVLAQIASGLPELLRRCTPSAGASQSDIPQTELRQT